MTWSRSNLIVAFHVVFCAAVSLAALVTPSKECVLNSLGQKACRSTPNRELEPSVKQFSCEENDFTCWCMKAVALTNDVRTRHGESKMLQVGPVAMLDNAVKHSKDMMHGLGLEHQSLPSVTSEVGCGVFISGENIAMNSGMNYRDPAEQCLEQWETSSEHFQNIMSDHDFVTVGIYREGGQTWCTQTFGTSSSESTSQDSKCQPVSQAAGANALDNGEQSAPENPTEDPGTTSPPTTRASQSSTIDAEGNPWKESSAELNLRGSVIPLPKCDVKEMPLPNGGKFILGSDCSISATVTSKAQSDAFQMAQDSKTFMGMLQKCGSVAQGTLTSDHGGLAIFDGYFRIPSGEGSTQAVWRALFAHEVAHACNHLDHSPQQDSLVADCLCEWKMPSGHYVTQSSPGYIQRLTCERCNMDC